MENHGRLRRLAAELSKAEHQERTRLAKLLHDDLQQLLLAAKLRLPVLAEAPGEQLEQHVARIDELLGESLSTARNLSQELSPPVLQSGTLPEAIDWLREWFADKHALAVAVETQDRLPHVPEYLRVFFFHAVRELLFNAVKHSGKMEARVHLSFQDGYLSVQVEDDGEGFDPVAVEQQLQRPRGFGLFHIRERLAALGGNLGIQTTFRGGACFRLVAPMMEGSEPMVQSIEPQRVRTPIHSVKQSQAESQTVRLLVVDDHAVVREGFVGLLDRQSNFKVIGEAADGEEAIRQAEALRPDAIIMDVEMPNVNGVEATRRLKARQPDVIVIGLSFHEAGALARAMTDAGVDAYVSKHAPAKDLVDCIHRLCRCEAGP